MGWKTFNDRLALVLMGLVGAMRFFLAVKEPRLRDKSPTLLPCGVPVSSKSLVVGLGQKTGVESPPLDHNLIESPLTP